MHLLHSVDTWLICRGDMAIGSEHWSSKSEPMTVRVGNMSRKPGSVRTVMRLATQELTLSLLAAA